MDHEQDDPRKTDPKRRAALLQEAHQENKKGEDRQAEKADKDQHRLRDRNELNRRQGRAHLESPTDQYVSTIQRTNVIEALRATIGILLHASSSTQASVQKEINASSLTDDKKHHHRHQERDHSHQAKEHLHPRRRTWHWKRHFFRTRQSIWKTPHHHDLRARGEILTRRDDLYHPVRESVLRLELTKKKTIKLRGRAKPRRRRRRQALHG